MLIIVAIGNQYNLVAQILLQVHKSNFPTIGPLRKRLIQEADVRMSIRCLFFHRGLICCAGPDSKVSVDCVRYWTVQPFCSSGHGHRVHGYPYW